MYDEETRINSIHKNVNIYLDILIQYVRHFQFVHTRIVFQGETLYKVDDIKWGNPRM